VREIYPAIAMRGGFVASGKFEQLHRDVPYSAVGAALGELLAQVLADTEETLAERRAAIAAAVGPDAPLVLPVLPGLAPLIGPCAAGPPELDPAAAQRRLTAALARVVQVFAKKAHPLVLFFDDVQWADAASLNLINVLLAQRGVQALLVVQAYRNNELDPAHPFAMALDGYEALGARTTRLALGALELADITDLLADVMRCPVRKRVQPIAAVILEKTHGNPFFLRQFIQTLYDSKLLAFDPVCGEFVIEPETIERSGITENVADLLAAKLARLPEATRQLLVSAAAIGNRFDAETLAITAAGLPHATVQRGLAPALESGMVTPLGSQVCIGSGADTVVGYARFAFQHNRVQQAAYDLLPAADRPQLHALIGRTLLAAGAGDGDRVFDVIHHLNLGRTDLTPAEQARLVELDLVAARRARRSGAFDVGAGLLAIARELVSHDRSYAQWFEVQVEYATQIALAGRPAEARALIRETLPLARPRDGATLEALDVRLCLQLGLLVESVAACRRSAALLDIELPTDPHELGTRIESEVAGVMARLAAGPVALLIDLPEMTDPDKLAAMGLLVDAIPAAYQVEPMLLALISAKLTALTLEHGSCALSARAYEVFAITLWAVQRHDLAQQLGELGRALCKRRGDVAIEAAVDFTYAMFVAPWQRPLEESFKLLRAVPAKALEHDDIPHAGYGGLVLTQLRAFKGDALHEILEDARRARTLAERFKLLEIVRVVKWYPWLISRWTGVALPPEEQHDPDVGEHELMTSGGSRVLLFGMRTLRMEAAYWEGDFAAVVAKARVAAEDLGLIVSHLFSIEFRFYYCLAAIAMLPEGGELDETVAGHRAELARFARVNPANFLHHHALVEAELARKRGDLTAAIRCYDLAIESAGEHAFTKVEALGHELAGRFWLERGKPAFGAHHYTKARDLYEHWGARVKARELELKRRELGSVSGENRNATIRSTTAAASTLDFATVVKASSAIASEIVLDDLLPKMMQMILENTGAQAGAIVLDVDKELHIRATKDQDGAVALMPAGIRLAEWGNVSERIVTYAMRTAECVVLADATRHALFRTDPYVRERRPRSVLCLPIVYKERVIGAVYLENNLVAGAFTMERLDALGILVAQLAISIENASMFARVASYRDHLEELVAERTRALTEAMQQLREQSLVRERMENELRLAQKLQSVGQLAAGVAHEINTPIQFIGNSIEFVSDAFESLFGLVEAYRSGADADAIAAAEEEADVDYLKGSAPQACARALDGVQRVIKIVRAMKAFSHPDSQGQAPTNLNIALENTLAVAVNEYRYVADIDLDLGADIPDVVCHPGELNQVFLNLIVNAAHAIGDVVQGTEQRGTIRIATRTESDSTVLISISDTGGGIPDAIRDRVFDPFFTTKEVGKGTGQGLALARVAIVDRHGGSLGFESRKGGGTTFLVRIPIHGKPEAQAA
jgi:predicted ATPase/signal transduction histidine kinase